VSKFNEPKKVLDQKTPSDEEVWTAIHYLDFELDRKTRTDRVMIALAAALLIVCVIAFLLGSSEL